MGGFWQPFETWLGGGPGGNKRIRTFRWLMIMGLAGISMMIAHSFLQAEPVHPADSSQPPPGSAQETFGEDARQETPFQRYEELYEQELCSVLTKIAGVGEVEVMVTLESTEEIVVYRDLSNREANTEERDVNGASRHITETDRSGKIVLYEVSGKSEPIVLKKIKPRIRGVIVVAGGAENAVVRKLITDAVSQGLEVPSHRISVAPRKQH